MITGESVPVTVSVGASVTGATVNTSGRLVVRTTAIGADTALAQMVRLVDEAQEGKADVQRLADRIAAWFVPVVIVLSAFMGAQTISSTIFTYLVHIRWSRSLELLVVLAVFVLFAVIGMVYQFASTRHMD
jgi:cation transport ATPase